MKGDKTASLSAKGETALSAACRGGRTHGSLLPGRTAKDAKKSFLLSFAFFASFADRMSCLNSCEEGR